MTDTWTLSPLPAFLWHSSGPLLVLLWNGLEETIPPQTNVSICVLLILGNSPVLLEILLNRCSFPVSQTMGPAGKSPRYQGPSRNTHKDLGILHPSSNCGFKQSLERNSQELFCLLTNTIFFSCSKNWVSFSSLYFHQNSPSQGGRDICKDSGYFLSGSVEMCHRILCSVFLPFERLQMHGAQWKFLKLPRAWYTCLFLVEHL